MRRLLCFIAAMLITLPVLASGSTCAQQWQACMGRCEHLSAGYDACTDKCNVQEESCNNTGGTVPGCPGWVCPPYGF